MSDNYIVSARKYRPATFHSVVGQSDLVSTLRNAVVTGRVGQAYLFCGPRGVGKTTCARIFARAVNCANPTPEGEACGECESCRSIDRGNSFNLIELDAASNNSADDIRTLIEQVSVPPQTGRYRIFIIDEVHMLSSAAFNAFLKTLEEPPKWAIFILATTEKHKLLPTILSRCQIYDFKRITIDDIVKQLEYVASQEGFEADPKALGLIARKADGAMRDALSIFDQVAASCQGKLTYQGVADNLNLLDYEIFFKLVDAFKRGDVPDALNIYKQVRDRGFDSLVFVNSLMQHVRDLMVAADQRTMPLLETPSDVAGQLCAEATSLPLPWYYRAMELLNETDYRYRTSSNKQLLVELTLIRLCQLLNPSPAPFDQPPGKTPMRDPSRAAYQSKAAAEERVVNEPAPKMTSPAQAPSGVQSPVAKPEAVPTPHPAERKVLRKTVRLTDDVAAEAPRERRSEAFSREDLVKAWRNFADEHPDRHILADMMRHTEPVLSGSHEYTVMVAHPAMVQAFESSATEVMDFLRSRLRNDFLNIRVLIDPNSDTAPRMLSPQEFVKAVVVENPMLGSFLKDIDAELS